LNHGLIETKETLMSKLSLGVVFVQQDKSRRINENFELTSPLAWSASMPA